MTNSPSQIDAGRTLDVMLAERQTLTAPHAVVLTVQLAEQIVNLHTAGLIHGAIAPPAIMLAGDDQARLGEAPESALLDTSADSGCLIPGIALAGPLRVPATIAAAEQWLRAAKIQLDP